MTDLVFKETLAGILEKTKLIKTKLLTEIDSVNRINEENKKNFALIMKELTSLREKQERNEMKMREMNQQIENLKIENKSFRKAIKHQCKSLFKVYFIN